MTHQQWSNLRRFDTIKNTSGDGPYEVGDVTPDFIVISRSRTVNDPENWEIINKFPEELRTPSILGTSDPKESPDSKA